MIFRLLIVFLFLSGCGSGGSSSGSSDDAEPPAQQEQNEQETKQEEKPKPEPAVPKIPSRPIEGSRILWKPISEKDGNLVVLLPSSYGNVKVSIHSVKTGKRVDSGRFTGRTNGNRPTYRFSLPGARYRSPSALKVGNVYFYVPMTANRYD